MWEAKTLFYTAAAWGNIPQTGYTKTSVLSETKLVSHKAGISLWNF